MPMGDFLDQIPSAVWIACHIIFLVAGIWAARKNSVFWFYVAAQVVFLLMFAGAFTMKMSVLLEQMMIFIMVILLARRKALIP